MVPCPQNAFPLKAPSFRSVRLDPKPAMDNLGPLTPSFTAPERCSTALVSCSTLSLVIEQTSFVTCTPTYGMTCGADGTPTRLADCYPNGKAETRTYNVEHSYSPGEACPTGWSAVSTGTFTTAEDISATGEVWELPSRTYRRATQVLCCPSCVTPTLLSYPQVTRPDKRNSRQIETTSTSKQSLVYPSTPLALKCSTFAISTTSHSHRL